MQNCITTACPYHVKICCSLQMTSQIYWCALNFNKLAREQRKNFFFQTGLKAMNPMCGRLSHAIYQALAKATSVSGDKSTRLSPSPQSPNTTIALNQAILASCLRKQNTHFLSVNRCNSPCSIWDNTKKVCTTRSGGE